LTKKTWFLGILLLGIPGLIFAQNFENHHISKPTARSFSDIHTNAIHRSDLITPVLLQYDDDTRFSLTDAIQNKAGIAKLSSAILPGSAQAVHGNWLRAGIYFAVEIAALYTHLEYRNRGKRGERNYERYADQHWSVVQYADWLVQYHHQHNISNPYINDLATSIDGREPAFDTDADWPAVDIELLRNAERFTPYITTDDLDANNFSHTLPAYGTQQYYELISKYYQYASGWKDFYGFHDQENTDPFLIDRFGGKASQMFWDGRDKAELFNDQFRFSNNMLSLLILNHFVSAFDAYFTVRLQNRNMEVGATGTPGMQFRLTYRF
jgi:hypothetical protein